MDSRGSTSGMRIPANLQIKTHTSTDMWISKRRSQGPIDSYRVGNAFALLMPQCGERVDLRGSRYWSQTGQNQRSD